MSDREMEERHLALANEHIAIAEANIAKMEDLVQSLEDSGRDAGAQEKLLAMMLVTLRQFLVHRNMILEAIDR